MKAIFLRSKNETSTAIKSYYFSVDPKPHFTAGQFTEITIEGVGKHWFTISSDPGDKEISITTRLTGSDYKNALDNLKKGDSVGFAEPMGDFVLPVDNTTPILMVAAGIGITPFLSILKDQKKNPSDRNLNLIYASRSNEDFLDISIFSYLLNSYKKITGSLTSKDILIEANKLTDPYIYISGPEPLVEKLVKDLLDNNFPDDQIIADYFPGYN